MPPLEGMTPSLGVRDVEETVRFYTEVLGLEATSTWSPEGTPEWAFLTDGRCELMVYRLPDGQQPGLTGNLYFHPEDVDALWARVKDLAPVAWEPTDRPYGMREFALLDPNGYRLAFGQPLRRDP